MRSVPAPSYVGRGDRETPRSPPTRTARGRHDGRQARTRAGRHDRHRGRTGRVVGRLPPRQARRAVRHPRCRCAHRRPLAGSLGHAPALQSGPLRLATGHALPRAVVPLADRLARWPTISRRTPDSSTCPFGVGRVSTESSRSAAASSCRPRTVGASPHATSSSRPGRSGSPTSRRSPLSSTRRSGSCIRTTTGTRPSSARARSSSSACRIPAPTSRSRPPTPATGRSSPASHTASCRSRSPTRSGPCSAGRSSSSCSDTCSRCARRWGGGCAPRSARVAARSFESAWGTWTGPASSATTRRPSASGTAARCSPTARCSTWRT